VNPRNDGQPDRPLGRCNPESLAAHASVQPTKRETCRRILAYGRWCGLRGFTTDQLAAEWGCDHNHVAPRVTELFRAGDLIITEKRRATRSGCLARVYVLSQKTSDHPRTTDDRSVPDDAQSRSAEDPPTDRELPFGDSAPERHRDDG